VFEPTFILSSITFTSHFFVFMFVFVGDCAQDDIWKFTVFHIEFITELLQQRR
jgi:hypothetical protein